MSNTVLVGALVPALSVKLAPDRLRSLSNVAPDAVNVEMGVGELDISAVSGSAACAINVAYCATWPNTWYARCWSGTTTPSTMPVWMPIRARSATPRAPAARRAFGVSGPGAERQA